MAGVLRRSSGYADLREDTIKTGSTTSSEHEMVCVQLKSLQAITKVYLFRYALL